MTWNKTVSWKFIIFIIIFSCTEPSNFYLPPQAQISISDKFTLHIISGENQKYVGISPEPIRYQIFDNENGLLVKSFDEVDLEGTFYSYQGNYYRESSTILHSKIRNVIASCQCFELPWIILPRNDPDVGPNPVDEIEIILNIFDFSFNEPIINSPVKVVHYVGD